jgi:prevent-host-death family protein
MRDITISSREFNQAPNEAKRAATRGPVFITYRGRPAWVLMSFKDFQRLCQQRREIADVLAMPDMADIAFEAPKVAIEAQRLDDHGQVGRKQIHLKLIDEASAGLEDVGVGRVRPASATLAAVKRSRAFK